MHTKYRVQIVQEGKWAVWGLPYASRAEAEKAANTAFPDLGSAAHRKWRVVEEREVRYRIEVTTLGGQWEYANGLSYWSAAAAERVAEGLSDRWPSGAQWRIVPANHSVIRAVIGELRRRGIALADGVGEGIWTMSSADASTPIYWNDHSGTLNGEVYDEGKPTGEVIESDIVAWSEGVMAIADFIASYSRAEVVRG